MKFSKIPHLKYVGKKDMVPKILYFPQDCYNKSAKTPGDLKSQNILPIIFSKVQKHYRAVEKNIANYQFSPIMFKWEIEGSAANSKQPILAPLTMRV